MTKDDALRLVRAYADVVPPDDHIRTMPDRMTDHSLGKAMRWLGYVQGVLVERGVFSLDEIKEHSRMFSSDPDAHSLEGLTPLERRVGKREFEFGWLPDAHSLGPAEGRSMIPLARRVGKREFGRLKK